MYVCLDCEHIFSEPNYWRETHGLDCGPYEDFDGCPICGGAYATAYECNECGGWITGEYVKTAGGHRICENCYHTMEIGDED